MTTPAPGLEPGQVLCPYCLETVEFDEKALHSRDGRLQYERLDVSQLTNRLRRSDVLRGAFQLCGNTDDVQPHFIPVPYLTNGRPLTVAMVGTSATGKSHLLTQMIAEVADGGLAPFGVAWQSVNPVDHSTFMRRVDTLRSGQQLESTGQTEFAEFVEALLLTGADGQVRPVAFFDLGGEDLRRTDTLLRFLLGIDALVFVVDPLLACPLPQLDDARAHLGVKVSSSDPAFQTVLDRLPRSGQYLDIATALVVNKADLLRFEPPVDRWLNEPLTAPLDVKRTTEESRDVYAFLRRHAAPAWTRPFDSTLRCTLHFASATGGQADNEMFPHGVRPRGVLAPLLSVLAMRGLLGPGPDRGFTTVGM